MIKILCSAIHVKDGKKYEHQPKNIDLGFVVCGRRHHNCFYTISLMGNPEYKNMGKGAELWDKFNNMGMMYCEKNPFRITQEDIDDFGKRFGKE